ncbi:MAG: thioesterase family protein [Halofilum sp. (in: g-proteobacteria)]|nr:thioesterase family protein [Halofilum sp. (in: g-proteobacteria)]
MNEQVERQAPDLADPASFAHWTHEKIRFQDVDRLDHVNNVAFAAFAECGRVEFLEAMTPALLQRSNAPFWVIAQLNLQFRAQAYFPGEVRVGTCVLRLGSSSVTLGQGIFSGDRCVVTAESVIVLVDPGSGRGAPLPDPIRSALAACRP